MNKPILITESQIRVALSTQRRPEKYIPIKTEQDIMEQRNVMGILDGRYPLSMSNCYVVGINGDCGKDCPIFKDGKCECHD